MGKMLGMSLAAVTVVGMATMTVRRSGAWERLVSWGTDPALSASVLPGDDLVVDPVAVDTRSLVIDAPPSAVWPWLVQMGDDRGGEYSYSVFGLPHRKGADRIVPEWQDLAIGDPVNEWVVRGLEPERALVLHSDIAGSWSWAFVLEPVEGGSRTRLIERIRSRPALPRRIGEAAMRVLGLVILLMVRKQMLTIRDRAELVQRTAHRGR
ncbi:MAG: hypothetical protein U9O18_08250 [Chloroflexota bacterium]|nr:hypothetical protein [Chloroflexota bacterium]